MSQLPKTADIVIIGAGVMGASIGFQLAKRQAGKVVVLDKDHVGRGGSGRSSALIRMHYSYPAEVKLALSSLRIFENWAEEVGRPGDFRKTGFVRIVAPHEIELLKKNVAMQRELSVKVELIDSKQLQQLEPDWNVDEVELAAYEPDSGYGDGAGVANDFLDRAREMGVIYVPRTQAVAFRVEGEKVKGVATEEGDIDAPVVVAATGPWSRPLFEYVGYELPVEAEFHQVAILKNAPEMKGGGCACIDSVTETYFRSDGRDKFLIGDFWGERPANPDNFPQRAALASLEEMIERTCRRIPKLENAEVLRGVTGIYDMTPDSRPLLGEIPGIDGLYVCAGFSGMGFKISPAIGIVMSELILDGCGKTLDISAFRANRFAENQPIQSEFEYADDSY